MADTPDWRLQNQEKYLKGAVLFRRPYRRSSPSSDHDHCEFCWANFMEEDYPDVLHDGYCTEDRYRWICEGCFTDFRDRFGWRVSDDETRR